MRMTVNIAGKAIEVRIGHDRAVESIQFQSVVHRYFNTIVLYLKLG